MYLIITTCSLAVWFLLRKYEPPKYSIQKFSRSNRLFHKTKILPLRVPWTVKFNNYDPIRTEKNTFQPWWFKLCFTDGKTRLLCETSAFLFAYVPHNPHGRTGASGRGILKYWGPNRIDVVVFMNKTNHIGMVNVFYHEVTTSFDLVHSGYIDHPANTDNAWLEGNIYVSKKHDLVEDVREDFPWLVELFKFSTPPSSPQMNHCT
jgi:hypothetical protein